jgi:glycyl-tRNA synthetase beta chain
LHSFLFELGIEELPDNVILPAINHLQGTFARMLKAEGLEYGQIKIGSTPRRLSIYADHLPARKQDNRISKIGPAINIAYTRDGDLSPAGNGFLRKSGGSKDDIFVQKTEKGDFLAVSYIQPGKDTADILRDWILASIAQIPLPKKMIWNSPALAFSRPIRWILALWDNKVIELEISGLKSGNISFGNRYLNLEQPLVIEHPDVYEAQLKEAGVIVNRSQRRELILQQCAELMADSPLYIKEDARLLETVTNLIEYPQAVLGEFDPKFLKLPEKIITSTTSQNQKYFSVYDADGSLTNKFVFISNGDPQCSDIIRAGNEKVVAARLEDAMWFFAEDSKHPLQHFLPKLQEVVFQSQLGTLADKTERIIRLSEYIASELKLSAAASSKAMRTAKLCKADLVTLMLGEKEFTKLQGYMGKQYALTNAEDPEVAEGIYEHYMPRGSNDSLPDSDTGAICAIADKVDSVTGIIGVGLMPTGSQDPFALRRAAGGVVQILHQRSWNLDLMALIDFAFGVLNEKVAMQADAVEKVKAFFEQRVSWLLKELGIGYDVVASVIHTDVSHLPHLIARARALQELKQEDDFIRLVIGFKRVANIISAEKTFAALNPALFDTKAEQDLHKALGILSSRISEALEQLDYASALRRLVEFGNIIDDFFDNVLVNCEDSELRQNRYALLKAIRDEFTRVADLSLIVVENETSGE